MLTLLYVLAFLDRGNIGNAKVAGMNKELKLTGTQYNLALTVCTKLSSAGKKACSLDFPGLLLSLCNLRSAIQYRSEAHATVNLDLYPHDLLGNCKPPPKFKCTFLHIS